MLQDTYGLSKKIGEETARSFARRFAKAYPDGKGVDIYAFRIGNVVEPHEYARDFKQYLMQVDVRKRNAWSYIDARDLGKMCHLASQTSGLGFQVGVISFEILDWITEDDAVRCLMRQMTPHLPSFLHVLSSPSLLRALRPFLI